MSSKKVLNLLRLSRHKQQTLGLVDKAWTSTFEGMKERKVSPEKLPLKIKARLQHYTKLRQVRIIPKSIGYTCEIVYKKLSEEGEINRRWYARRVNKNRITGIDLGTRNVVTIANNIGYIPIIIKGGILKSINQFYTYDSYTRQVIEPML